MSFLPGPCTVCAAPAAHLYCSGQVLTLVHFSAQPQPLLSLKSTETSKSTENTQRVPHKVLTLSQKVTSRSPWLGMRHARQLRCRAPRAVLWRWLPAQALDGRGRAVQVHPMKLTFRAPGYNRSELKYDKPLSRFADTFNLCRCSEAAGGAADQPSHKALCRRGGGVFVAAPSKIPGMGNVTMQVGRCKSKTVETRVETAWLKLLKLKYDVPLSSFVFDFNLRQYHADCHRANHRGAEAHHPGRGVIENTHDSLVRKPGASYHTTRGSVSLSH